MRVTKRTVHILRLNGELAMHPILQSGRARPSSIALLDLGEPVHIDFVLAEAEAPQSARALLRGVCDGPFNHCLHAVRLAVIWTELRNVARLIAFEACLLIHSRLGTVTSGVVTVAVAAFDLLRIARLC